MTKYTFRVKGIQCGKTAERKTGETVSKCGFCGFQHPTQPECLDDPNDWKWDDEPIRLSEPVIEEEE